MFFEPYRQSGMTWKVVLDSSVTSGRWPKRGGVRETALDDGFLDNLGAGSFSGVDVLSLSAFAPGDRLDDLEGLDSLGEVEALRSALRADAFSRKPSSILMAGDASALRSSSSILCAQAGPGVPTVVGKIDWDRDCCGKGMGARV